MRTHFRLIHEASKSWQSQSKESPLSIAIIAEGSPASSRSLPLFLRLSSQTRTALCHWGFCLGPCPGCLGSAEAAVGHYCPDCAASETCPRSHHQTRFSCSGPRSLNSRSRSRYWAGRAGQWAARAERSGTGSRTACSSRKCRRAFCYRRSREWCRPSWPPWTSQWRALEPASFYPGVSGARIAYRVVLDGERFEGLAYVLARGSRGQSQHFIVALHKANPEKNQSVSIRFLLKSSKLLTSNMAAAKPESEVKIN